jgi:hypothetical protein
MLIPSRRSYNTNNHRTYIVHRKQSIDVSCSSSGFLRDSSVVASGSESGVFAFSADVSVCTSVCGVLACAYTSLRAWVSDSCQVRSRAGRTEW